MKLEQELVEAHETAGALARPGEQVAAVIAVEPEPGQRRYLAAFEAGEDVEYLLVDPGGAPVSDRRMIRDAVSLIALCELAEELSLAVAADTVRERFGAVAAELRSQDPAAAGAAVAVAEAAEVVAAAAAGPRVATPAFLDAVAAVAFQLGSALDAYAAHAERLAEHAAEGGAADALARAAWQPLAEAGALGDPSAFAQSMASSTASVDALVADVLHAYRGPLAGTI